MDSLTRRPCAPAQPHALGQRLNAHFVHDPIAVLILQPITTWYQPSAIGALTFFWSNLSPEPIGCRLKGSYLGDPTDLRSRLYSGRVFFIATVSRSSCPAPPWLRCHCSDCSPAQNVEWIAAG
ncbi:hypothetical protein ACJJTC_008553 [Scirpophaga incertulas]